jgi:hypothetical protein
MVSRKRSMGRYRKDLFLLKIMNKSNNLMLTIRNNNL